MCTVQYIVQLQCNVQYIVQLQCTVRYIVQLQCTFCVVRMKVRDSDVLS
jgi:hypothetical protein